MLVATWNVNSIMARLPLIEEFIRTRQPHIVALQETKIEDAKFPVNFFKDFGYDCVFKGQKAYNGVAIASKLGIDSYEKDFHELEGSEKRIIMAEINGIKLINAYFPHGKMVGSLSYKAKIEFIERIAEYLKNFIDEKLILVGDFNVAMEERDVYNPEIMQYSIGFSKDEREALKKLYSIGFVDVFRMHNKEEKQYTWWDYRANSFKRNAGMRIDYIWATKRMAERSKNCYVDVEMRAKEKPSDHAPVIAEFEI